MVAPTSVVGTWVAEAARFCPGLPVVAVTETARRSGHPLAERVQGAAVVVTSYALLRLDDEEYLDDRWAGLVLDEAQQVKNRRSKTYAVCRRLATPFTLAITGTPLENSLMDLWSLLSLAAPGLVPDPERRDLAPADRDRPPPRAARRAAPPHPAADAAAYQGAGGPRPAAARRAAA